MMRESAVLIMAAKEAVIPTQATISANPPRSMSPSIIAVYGSAGAAGVPSSPARKATPMVPMKIPTNPVIQGETVKT